ncbi:hypothetical protein [Pedobacter aquatilis]|uniref:hypothetical protein n=1 Tax=Pedobacter aquatilis TaxID=351343 RepID=UPI00292D2284|nr:hypothetical protein [Pedobacter aquatilis]
MFSVFQTRIIPFNDSVIILRQVNAPADSCRVFVDGIDKGLISKLNGKYSPAKTHQTFPNQLLEFINEIDLLAEAVV